MKSPSNKINNLYSSLGILLILFLLFFISVNSIFYNFIGFTESDSAKFTFSRTLYWVSVILLWLYARKIEKQNLLIWEERKYGFGHYLLSLVGLFGAIIIGVLVVRIILNLIGLNESSTILREIINIFRDNHLLIFFTAITAGVTEELIFRGYLQPRLEIILKNRHIAILTSSLLFGLLHFKYGTVVNIIGPFVIGVIFSYYYSKYRNIKALILCHILWDLMSIYVHLIISSRIVR